MYRDPLHAVLDQADTDARPPGWETWKLVRLEEHTLEEVAAEEGVSRERVRQKVKRVDRILRRRLLSLERSEEMRAAGITRRWQEAIAHFNERELERRIAKAREDIINRRAREAFGTSAPLPDARRIADLKRAIETLFYSCPRCGRFHALPRHEERVHAR